MSNKEHHRIAILEERLRKKTAIAEELKAIAREALFTKTVPNCFNCFEKNRKLNKMLGRLNDI